jgi:hypothetical protein
MPQWLVALLALLFLVHLLAFLVLALRRGGYYYWLLTALFLTLTASFTLRLLLPGWQVAGQAVYVMLRYLSWAIAAVTVPILIARLLKRKNTRR